MRKIRGRRYRGGRRDTGGPIIRGRRGILEVDAVFSQTAICILYIYSSI